MAYDASINVSVTGLQQVERLQNSLGNLTKGFGELRNLVGAFAASSFVANAVAMASALDDVASASGIALQNVVGFAKGVKDFGGTLEGASTGIARLNNYIQSAADGNKSAQDAFLKLGFTLDDLRTMSEADILRKTISGLDGMGKGAEQTALKMAIFGKSFANVGIDELNANLDSYIAKAGKSAGAIKAAADAEENFGKAVAALQTALLQILEPITKFIASIKPETIQFFATTVIDLIAVMAGFKIFSMAAGLLMTFVDGMVVANLTARGFIATLIAAQWSKITTAFSMLGSGIAGLGTAFKVASGGATIFAAALGMISSALLRLIPYVGLVVAAVDIFSAALEALTGKGILSWLDELGAKMASILGISYKTSEQKDKEAAAAKEAADQADRQAKAAREVADAMQKEKDALEKSLNAYRLQNEEFNKKFKLETDSIRMSERAKLSAEQRLEAETKYNQEMIKLQDELAAKKKSTSESDKGMIPVIEGQMAKLTAAYQQQLGAVDGLVAARVRETQANQLSLFQTQSMVDAQKQLIDLQNETGKVFLPLLEQKYMDVAAAADASARAAIAAEEARRKEKLNPQEVQAYYDAARKGVRELQAAQYELNKAQEKYNLLQFGRKSVYDMEKKIRDVQFEMATATMPELARQYAEIDRAAMESAKAAVEAEAIRRNVTQLDPTEIQAYYDAAIKGADRLKAKMKEQYMASRDFSTGWKKAFNEYADNATNAARTAERIFAKFTQGMEDMLVNFVKTGKFEWQDFLDSMLEELLRSQIRELMASTMSGIGGLFGGMFGGMGGGTGGAGQSPTNPMYVVDVSGGMGRGMGGGVGGAVGAASQGAGLFGSLGKVWDSTKNVFGGIADSISGLFGGGKQEDPLGDFISNLPSEFVGPPAPESPGLWDSITSGIGSLFDGWFANGGTIGAGKFGVVGERGPELVGGPATVTPLGGSTNVTYNINAVDAASFKAMIAADPSFIHSVAMQGGMMIPGRR